jgi:predicted DNA-binding protein (UPF0251 family)
MSREEVNKLEIMQQIRLKKLKQREAAAILGISERQVRRVWKRYSSNGAREL